MSRTEFVLSVALVVVIATGVIWQEFNPRFAPRDAIQLSLNQARAAEETSTADDNPAAEPTPGETARDPYSLDPYPDAYQLNLPPPPGERGDLNQATARQLARLPGFSLLLAQRIVQYRERIGGFTRREDLYSIAGLGPRRLSRLKQYYQLPEPAGDDAPPRETDQDENTSDEEQLPSPHVIPIEELELPTLPARLRQEQPAQRRSYQATPTPRRVQYQVQQRLSRYTPTPRRIDID